MNVTLTQSLNKWLKTFEMSVNEECVERSAQDLSDGVFIAHVLNHISPAFFTTEWLSNIKKSDSNENEEKDEDDIRVDNLSEISSKVISYYREILGKEIEDNMKPDVAAIVCDLNNSSEQLGLLLRLIFGCAVNCDAKDYFIKNIVDINDEDVMNCLKNSLTQELESIDRINTNNNLSEMSEVINCSNNCISNDCNNDNNDCNIDCNNDNNVIINTNLSNDCSDINAKESFAQLSNNDLEIKLNQMSAENCKLLNEKEKLEKLVERMNKTGVGFVDPNSTSNGINEELLIRYQNKIETLQKDIYKMEEMKDNFMTTIELLQEEVSKLKANNIQSLLINREAVAGVCDRDLLYKFIISQLLYDGHRSLALGLSSVEKLKQVCPPSDRLHNLVAIALKAEGDSPSLSDDSIHPMNLIDLDYEVDRNSASSRASLYEPSNREHYFRGRSFSPDNEIMIANSVNMSHRMSDMGRMISKTSPIAEMNQIHSNDSIGSRSTPELNISSYGQSVNNSMRPITPNSRETEMMGSSSMLGNASQQLDLTQLDLITQINLAQLAYFNTDPTSVASSSTNTPSPTPMNPSVPLENGGLVLNEAALKNLSQLAKMSANEVQNGLMPPNSTSPGSITSTLGRCSTNSTTKPNVMQIRIKFGQLGGQKGQFSSPHGFCLGVDEEIVIADTNNHRICIFDKAGDFKHSFGVPGKDEAQLWYPRKVAIIRTTGNHSVTPAPRYVICDRGAERSRMQIFTRSGHFVRKIAIRYIDIVAGLAITPNGHIVAVDSVSPTVFVIAESGDLLRWFDCSEYMREPSDIAINNREYYICDFKGHCVVVFNDEGQYMRKIGCEGLTSFPNGIDISDAGDILVGDSHGNRFHVVVFDRNGTLISEFECPYVKVSRCCGLKITSEGYVVTLAKNNHHVLILNTLYIM